MSKLTSPILRQGHDPDRATIGTAGGGGRGHGLYERGGEAVKGRLKAALIGFVVGNAKTRRDGRIDSSLLYPFCGRQAEAVQSFCPVMVVNLPQLCYLA
jgi:hypothetical protein